MCWNTGSDTNPFRWIGKKRTISGPGRLPDLTLCDFNLLDYVKEKVNTTPPNSTKDMKQRLMPFSTKL